MKLIAGKPLSSHQGSLSLCFPGALIAEPPTPAPAPPFRRNADMVVGKWAQRSGQLRQRCPQDLSCPGLVPCSQDPGPLTRQPSQSWGYCPGVASAKYILAPLWPPPWGWE